MNSKKMRPSSLLEDDLNWVGPGPSPVPRPISPLSCGGERPGTPAFASSSHQILDRERDQDQGLSCVYVYPPLPVTTCSYLVSWL